MDLQRKRKQGLKLSQHQRWWKNHIMVHEKRPIVYRSHATEKNPPVQQERRSWKHELQVRQRSLLRVFKRLSLNVSGDNLRRSHLPMLKKLHSTIPLDLQWPQRSHLQSQSKSLLLWHLPDMLSRLELQVMELEERSTLELFPKLRSVWLGHRYRVEPQRVNCLRLSLQRRQIVALVLFLTIQGPREEEHAGPYLHRARTKQAKDGSQNNGPILQRRPSPRDRRRQWLNRRVPTPPYLKSDLGD